MTGCNFFSNWGDESFKTPPIDDQLLDEDRISDVDKENTPPTTEGVKEEMVGDLVIATGSGLEKNELLCQCDGESEESETGEEKCEEEKEELLQDNEEEKEATKEEGLRSRLDESLESTVFLERENAEEMMRDLKSPMLDPKKVKDYFNALKKIRQIKMTCDPLNEIFLDAIRSEYILHTEYYAWKSARLNPGYNTSNPIPIRLGRRGILPAKQHKDSVTYDLFASRRTTIPPGEVRAVPLDIFFDQMTPPHFAQISPRAGLAHSKQISAIPTTIPPRIKKSIAVSIENNSKEMYTFDCGSRVANLHLGPNPWCGITNGDSNW